MALLSKAEELLGTTVWASLSAGLQAFGPWKDRDRRMDRGPCLGEQRLAAGPGLRLREKTLVLALLATMLGFSSQPSWGVRDVWGGVVLKNQLLSSQK